MDKDFLDDIFFNSVDSDLKQRITTAHNLSKTNILKGLTADRLYHNMSAWFHTTPKVEDMRKLLTITGKRGKPLEENEFVEFYRSYIYPLFTYLYGNHGRIKRDVESDKDKIFDQKEDFLNLIWILYNCLEAKEVATNVRLIKLPESEMAPKKKTKRKRRM